MRMAPTLAVIATLAVAGAAIAQQATSGEEPVLHEFLRVSNEAAQPMIGSASSGDNPAAIAAGDKVLPMPSLDEPMNTSGVLGKSGTGSDRMTKMTPDDQTGGDAQLTYEAVFNPDVLPFKRMSSLDAPQADFTLVVSRPQLTDLPVGGKTDKSRDRFWGSVAVQLTTGQPAPLPSVAPDMRILSYEVKPALKVTFSKDGADNYYVRTDEKANGTYRLVFLADADAGYFAPQLPTKRSYTPLHVQTLTPSELQVDIPPAVRAEAMKTLERIGIKADEELGSVFNKLVAYFRAFEEGTLDVDTGNLYRDLCDTQTGVCRHRSYAFVITARTLGLPARYVQNEAHAFAEVWFPERNWVRIDLGGAALRMEVTGGENKTLHRPRSEDPFSKPRSYQDSFTEIEGDVSGLSSQQVADKKKGLDEAPASGEYDSVGNGSSDTASGSGAGTDESSDRIEPDPGLPTVKADPRKATVDLIVTRADASAYRGDILRVEGRVATSGKGIPNHAVDVFLAPAGEHGAHSVRIGSSVSGPDGLFSQDFTIPAGLEAANYEIYLSTNPDAFYNGSISD